MVGQTLRLPIGYWDNDTFHKGLSLRPVTGSVEDVIQDRTKSHAHRVTQLLAGCTQRIGSITEVTPDVIRELSVGDRDFLLLKLRELTFGSKIECILTCPSGECGKKMDVDFDIGDLVFEEKELTGPYLTVRTDDATIEFRLPNGGDQEAVADWAAKDPNLAENVILKRCIRSINGKPPSETEINDLSQGSKDAIQKQMEGLDSLTDLDMRAVCPECGNEFLAPFDIQDFFLNELSPSLDALYREVHYLAFYYHWAEKDILSFPRWKRKKYIELLINDLSSRGEEVF